MKLTAGGSPLRGGPVGLPPVAAAAAAVAGKRLVFVPLIVDRISIVNRRPNETWLREVRVGIYARIPTPKPEIRDETTFEKLQLHQGDLFFV
jgi:hypothetical protein